MEAITLPTETDVISVDYARILKRAGWPQDSKAYWEGIMPSLSNLANVTYKTKEDRKRVHWRLAYNKPPEPTISAYTIQEIKNYFITINKADLELVKVTEHPTNKKKQVATYNNYTWVANSAPDAFVQVVIWILEH